MSKSSRKSLIVFVLLVSVFLLSTQVLAVTRPYFTYTGAFDYTAADNELSIKINNISGLYYADGTQSFNAATEFMNGGWFTLGISAPLDSLGARTGNIFNGGTSSTAFGPSVGVVPGPGGANRMTFSLFDKNGINVLKATVDDFTVVQNGSLFEVNVLSNLNNVKGTGNGIETSPSATTSKFINDISSPDDYWNWGNLYMKFNFAPSAGANDFTVNKSGTVSGTFSVMPEPISAILFATGGATLAIRCFIRKRNKQVS